MRDIPIFTGRYGAASLILREIPFSGCAYVLVQAAAEGQAAAFLDECRAFCRAAGAAQSLASADVPLPLAHAYDLLQLCSRRSDLQPPGRPVELTPVTAENAGVSLAASVIMLIPALLIFLFGQRYLEAGISASGMKD